MKGLNNKTVLVCGGSKGIGAAAVREFVSSGAKVVVLSRTAGVWDKDSSINEGQVKFISVDFSDKNSKEKAFKEIQNMDIDIIVNNAGGPPTGPSLDSSIDDFSKAMEVHLYTFQELAQTIAPKMIEKKYGKIINIISVTATIPLPNFCVSNTLRGALLNWSKTLSKELGSFGITVNNVLPGYTETERLKEVIQSVSKEKGISKIEFEESLTSQIPMKRFATPKEVAESVLFLASDHASFINGVSIPVDGGWTPCA